MTNNFFYNVNNFFQDVKINLKKRRKDEMYVQQNTAYKILIFKL